MRVWMRRETGELRDWVSMHGTLAQAKRRCGIKTFCSRTWKRMTGVPVGPREIVEVEITFEIKHRILMGG